MGRSGNGGVDLRKERPAPFVKSSVGASDPHRLLLAPPDLDGEQKGKRIAQR